MAKKTETIVTLIDDLDGSVGAETVYFVWEGKPYELELSKKNAARLQDALAPYLAAARRGRKMPASRTRPRVSSESVKAPGEQLQTMRDWARANGYKVANRGRISAEIQAAYHSS